jgi:hypothetical protein
VKNTLTVFAFLIGLLAFSAAVLAAQPDCQAYAATGTPHIVISGEVWLLNESGEKLFLLPDTYYARINNLDDAYYYVTFNGVSGKVSKNVVSTTGYHIVASGTSLEMQIDSKYIEFVSINLKKQPNIASENVVALPVTDSFTFIGQYPTMDGMWYYVKYNQYYGYIRSERTSIPDIRIAAFQPEAEPSSDNSQDNIQEENKGLTEFFNGLEGNTLRVIVIAALAVVAILVIFVLFRPKKGRKEKYYED